MHSRSAGSEPGITIQFWLSAVLLLLAGLLGGGRGGFGDVLVQLTAIVLLGWLAWRHRALDWQGPVWVRWLPLLAVALPIFQLLPIPSGMWTWGPARSELAAQMAQAGTAHAHALSLDPAATERALWSLLPACALFLSCLSLSKGSQRQMCGLLVVLALLNFLLGLAQLADGQQSTLRFYLPTNPNDAVGFFANRNHFASLLAMTLPPSLVATAWLVSERLGGRQVNPLLPIAGVVVVILLIFGILLGRSRGGLLLGMIAVLGSLPIVMSLRRQRGTKRVLTAAIALGLMLSTQFALFGMFQRLQSDPLDDGRWRYARVTIHAAHAYAPLGSGLGTFRQAYQPFEALDNPGPAIVNHAHNDYLELWLEGGWLALGLLAAAGVAWFKLSWSLWRNRSDSAANGASSRLLARTAWLAASLALLHSALDYPLRTTAAMTAFALLAAIAFSGMFSGGGQRADRTRALA